MALTKNEGEPQGSDEVCYGTFDLDLSTQLDLGDLGSIETPTGSRSAQLMDGQVSPQKRDHSLR
jgi:hypothetical protein